MEDVQIVIVKGLSNDALTIILKLSLNMFPLQSAEMNKQRENLAIACKGFNSLLKIGGRPELKPFYSVKEHWLDTVGASLRPNDANYHYQLAYYKGCAQSVKLSKNGPVGYPENTVVMKNLNVGDGERLAHFNSLNYLECQFLYLTEFATLNKYQDWCYELLEKLRSLLPVNQLYTQQKFGPMRILTEKQKNQKKQNISNIDKEHTVYLYCTDTLTKPDMAPKLKPMKEFYGFRSEHHLKRECVIL